MSPAMNDLLLLAGAAGLALSIYLAAKATIMSAAERETRLARAYCERLEAQVQRPLHIRRDGGR